jgi:hypothetical protein
MPLWKRARVSLTSSGSAGGGATVVLVLVPVVVVLTVPLLVVRGSGRDAIGTRTGSPAALVPDPVGLAGGVAPRHPLPSPDHHPPLTSTSAGA